MYEDYWGLEFPPFEESHVADSFVDNDDLQLARMKLVQMILHGQPAVAIIGQAGVGKTALAMAALRELSNHDLACSLVLSPSGSPQEILDCIARDLGGNGPHPIAAMESALYGLAAAGRRACILVDEAHAITKPEILESLRMLLNFEVNGQIPLSLILVGQNSLIPQLKSVSSFDQRIALTISLQPFTPDNSKHYILSRLKMAGCSRGIFTRSSGERICEVARGIPRNINRLCELCLVVGYGFGVKKIKSEIVDVVAKDLGLLSAPGNGHIFLPPQESLTTPASMDVHLSPIATANRIDAILEPIDGDIMAEVRSEKAKDCNSGNKGSIGYAPLANLPGPRGRVPSLENPDSFNLTASPEPTLLAVSTLPHCPVPTPPSNEDILASLMNDEGGDIDDVMASF